MTEKDLMEGLNHIEDSLIEEAAAPVRHRRFLRLPAAAAAVLLAWEMGAYIAMSRRLL